MKAAIQRNKSVRLMYACLTGLFFFLGTLNSIADQYSLIFTKYPVTQGDGRFLVEFKYSQENFGSQLIEIKITNNTSDKYRIVLEYTVHGYAGNDRNYPIGVNGLFDVKPHQSKGDQQQYYGKCGDNYTKISGGKSCIDRITYEFKSIVNLSELEREELKKKQEKEKAAKEAQLKREQEELKQQQEAKQKQAQAAEAKKQEASNQQAKEQANAKSNSKDKTGNTTNVNRAGNNSYPSTNTNSSSYNYINEKSPEEIQQEQKKQSEQAERLKQEEVRRNGERILQQQREEAQRIEAEKVAMVKSWMNSTQYTLNNTISYDSYMSNINSSIKLPNSEDPRVLLQSYKRNLQNINDALDKRKQEIDAEQARMVAYGEQSNALEDKGKAIGAIIAGAMNSREASKKSSEAREAAQKELEAAFNNIKTKIINANDQKYDYYIKLGATKLQMEEQNYCVNMANYYECYSTHINRNFSYRNDSWLENNCDAPSEITFSRFYEPTADEIYQAAKRKSTIDNEFFKKAAIDYIDMAITKNPIEPEYYYFKSTIADQSEMKEKCLQMTLKLDPNNTNAQRDLAQLNSEEQAAYMKAKKSGQIEDYEAYYTNFPKGVHINEVAAEIEKQYFSISKDLAQKKQFKDAISYCESYLELFPYSPNASAVKQNLADVVNQVKYIKIDSLLKEKKYYDDQDKWEGTKSWIYGLSMLTCGGAALSFLIMYAADNEKSQYLIYGVSSTIACGVFYRALDDCSDYYSRKSEEIKSQIDKLSFSPTYDPRFNNYGLAFRVKF